MNKSGIRTGWRFAAFFLLATFFYIGLEVYVRPWLCHLLQVDEHTLNSGVILISEVLGTIAIFAATWIMATCERRRVDSYGLPISDAFRGYFWEGVALGIAVAGIVAGGMYAFGGLEIHGFALQGNDWFVQPFLWIVAMIFLGVSEEMWLRGYGLQVLGRGIGFWPAAVITSLIFGAMHLNKPEENFIDIFNIVILGIVLCITVRRTGSLWLAVGFHTTFDFMQFFVIGTPNGGNKPIGTLLQSEFLGPAWLNGGSLGTEASYIMLPVIFGFYVYIVLRYKSRNE
ncbi:CPBP family intramembrane metalloprotease [Aquirhabdus parva]|uniref:CPBP family intramembrane metalloprotease n=2 Tax=Aquirhabdus parva TaxID=2283318 RepID=A0A345P8E5_9GAMM|nr:CPBP family intramembrane metalloprotease [Aquirhabdus parva]